MSINKYKKFNPLKSMDKSIKLIKSERIKSPTAKGQIETVRTYKIKETPHTEFLIIGDEKKGKKNIAVYEGYINIGYFSTLSDAKQALLMKYGD